MASKIHVRRNEAGEWVDVNGTKYESGVAGIVYYYGKKIPSMKRTTSTVSSSRPHISANAGIHADQVAQFNKECGPGCHYEAGTGNLVSTSYAAREREARRRGMSFS